MLLATRTWGDTGAPVVVLVHGVVASSATWWRVGPALAARGHHVLAVDLPGHGAGPRIDRPFTLADLAEHLWATVDAAGVVPAVLWGHSLGALAVLEAVRRRPGWTGRLVLEDPPGPASSDGSALAADVRAAVALARADPDALLDDVRRANPGWAAGDVAAMADAARCQADEVAAAVEARIIPDLVGALRGLRLPTLVVLGAPERGSMVTGAERAAVLDAAPAAVALDAGHAVHRDAAERYLEVTTAWLEDGRTGA